MKQDLFSEYVKETEKMKEDQFSEYLRETENEGILVSWVCEGNRN